MSSFPKGWFFIKNLNSGYVLSTEKSTVGEPVVMTSIKSKDIESQLWQHGEDGRLHNKKTGFVLDVSKGSAKVGAEIVQQHDSDSSSCQTFGLSSDGHIYLTKDSNLVLGIKESFFTRRDGQHVHIQKLDRNIKERKEQRWEFMLATQKRASVLSGPMHSLKRTISGASLGSFSSASLHFHHDDDEDTCLDESNQLTSFPDHEFFIKSESTGYFIGVEFSSASSSGARICLSPLRKSDYETQLWHYDLITGRLINKASGFALTAEEISDEASICQSSSITEKDLNAQSWIFANSGEIKLKNDHHYVLGFKKDNWFGLNRDSAALLLQKQTDHKTHSYQRFVIVAPVFKKKTTEITTVTEQIGIFPEGHFFIKNQKHGLVITVLETDKLAAQVVAAKLDPKNFNRQLWSHSDGFLINKESKLVLDVRGGCIADGSEICQYKQKNEGFENQQWGLSPEGYIHAKAHKDIVLAVSSVNRKDQLPVRLADKKTPDHSEQRWNFVLPVFKQISTSVPETSVQKKVHYHNYAQYPSGWFFIRSFVGTSPESPFVLTADSVTEQIHLHQISKENWRNQLWMYWNGVLINFATQLAIDVENDNLVAGSSIRQELRKAGDIGQRWRLTIDGYLIHGSNPSLTLIPQHAPENDSYNLILAEHLSAQQEHRWSLLSPEIKVENNTQVLVRWTVSVLTEWKQFNEKAVQKVIHRIANWPEETFFITAQGSLALVPEKPEAFAFLAVKKLELGESSEHFKWTFRDGYLTHVTTGLVLHAADDLVGGSQLQIRDRLVSESNTIDQRQSWAVKTDGSIVSQSKNNLGFTLIQQDSRYQVQLAYASDSTEHYAWGFARGHYETRYSDIYKKEVRFISRTERILLTLFTRKTSSSHNTKLVTHSYGIFPDSWFYICSRADKSLVLTAPNKKEGAKLTLQKLDYKIFRRQLWHVQDDGCLVNLDSEFVIDVAGGAIEAGSNIIQWHQKFLKRHRQNQMWALSVDGHIHPKNRPNYVLGAKDKNVVENSEIQLQIRGSLDLECQRWTFAIPRFGRTVKGVKGVASVPGVLERNDSGLFVEDANDASVQTSTSERYERVDKYSVVRRWGIFPDGGFFIRASCGDQHLSLTVEQKARTCENGSTEHEVTLRPINFKSYKWHFWTYENGYLINVQTGLALDATAVKGVLTEDGLRTPLFVREKSMSEYQFWALTASGEIYLRSDERLVIGVSNSSRVQVSGAQVGLRQLSVRKFVNEKGQRETALKSEQWLRWVFSKPVYRTTTITTTTSTENASNASDEIQGLDDQKLDVKETEESSEDIYDDESDESDESDDEDEDSSSLTKLDLAGNVGIATAGAGILAGALGAASKVSEAVASAPEVISSALGKSKDESQAHTATQNGKKKTSYHSLKFDRKESFRTECDYVPTGFEKIVRYKTHNLPNFPASGYFFIKSYLHGMVLDVVDGDTRDGAYVVLAPMKSANFASQLWSYKEDRIVNLKGHNLVLDATMTDTIVAGEKLVISTRITGENVADQQWELGTDGLISLKSKPDLVLGVKELKHSRDQTTIDVYLQEEKPHLTDNIPRPEQRWEIKIPALIPIEQTSSGASTNKFTIIEAGKISAISSCISAIAAFGCLKQTFQHKITADNQWPSSQNWFLISADSENAFLSSGITDSTEVKFVKLGEHEDHKQYLWTYINGYLINYKHMLRLVYDKNSHKLMLSGSNETLHQIFYISSKGVLHVKIHSDTIYFSIAYSSHNERYYQLIATDHESTENKPALQLHIPVFSSTEAEKESKVALSTVVSWIITSQKSSKITTTTTTTTTTIVQKYGLFPRATWFFIKVDNKSGDSLVLAVKDSSTSEGTSLVLKKLNFKDYKNQLWTYRSGVLINYGSKLVIDVEGDITESAKLIQATEAGVSSQKWALTTDGRIYLDSYAQFTLGYAGSDELTENSSVQLTSIIESKSSASRSIVWRFSVPIFSKVSTSGSETNVSIQTTASNVSSIERLTASIEANALIESVEEAEIEVEDISVKKNNAVNNNVPSAAVIVDNEKHHSFQDILTNVGIAATATVAAVGVVEGASKIAEKVSEHHQKKTEEKEQMSGSIAVQEKVTSAASDKKATETIVVHRSRQSSIQIIEESRMITRAWKIVFSQRVRRCKTKEELIETIEESREDLFRRLDEHLRVHASVDHLVVGAVPDWHVSVHQIKELYRARVFEKFLGRLHSGEATELSQLEFESTIATASEEVENHYQLVIETESKKAGSEQTDSTDSTESILVTVDNIKVVVRYWLISLHETVRKAQNNGSSEEEIKSIIESARKELSEDLTQIKATASNYLKESSAFISSKQTSITKTIEAAITQTEDVMSSQISKICSHKQYLVDEEHWLDVTRLTEEHLSSQLQVYQTAITQDIVDIQKAEVKETDKAKISVVLDEKMVGVAQQTVANKLLETQTKLSSWFIETTQQIRLLIEEHDESSEQTVKQDTLAIIDAAHVEINTRIEETKLVLRAYYAHLTYLSWAERRRLEYSLDSIKASISANISQFKKSIAHNEVSKQQIIRYSSYSFGANASRIILSDLQSIVTKVVDVKKTTSVVNKTQELEGEKNKLAIVGDDSNTKVTEVKKTTETIETVQPAQSEVSKKTQVTKTEDVKQTEKIKASQGTKVVDTIQTEVEETKVSKVSNKPSTSAVIVESQKQSSENKTNAASSAVLGAAAAAIASAAIFHHHDAKENDQQKSSGSMQVADKVDSVTENTSIDAKKNTSIQTTAEKKSDTLVVVYDQVHVVIQNWIVELNKKVYECAQKKTETTHQEIDRIIHESQQQLAIEIEKAKRNTTFVIGTSQTSFHNTLSWVRSTVWRQSYEIKQVGYEIATTTETDVSQFEQKLESIKESTLQKIDGALDKAKTSASVIHKVGHESAATIAAGKKFEGVDYSKSNNGDSIEKTKVLVGILIEDTRLTIQDMFRKLNRTIIERRKQGGENVEADIKVIIKNHREEINAYVLKSKTDFKKRIDTAYQASSDSSKVDVELQTEAVKKVHATLEQVQENVVFHVSKIEQVATSTVTSETEYNEQLNSITHETCEKIDSTLAVSETIIGHHIEVTAESVSTHQDITTEETSSSNVSLGVQYGLIVVSETTKNVSSHISALVERVYQRLAVDSDSFEQDVHGLIVVSEEELDLILEEAKSKITYELSMVSAQEKVEEKRLLESLEAIRQSARLRIAQVNKIAASGKTEIKTTSEKLLQIAEESRHEIKSHLESVKHAVTNKAEKVTESVHGVVAPVVSHTQESEQKIQKQEEEKDHHSKVELAKKILKGSAGVAVGTAIAVEIGKKLSEHKKKEEETKQQEKQAIIVIEEVKTQFSKWLSTLTETVISQTKQSTVSTEEISITVEKSKVELLEMIKVAKSNQAIVQKHQQDVLSWIEETATAQAARIHEIAVSSTSAAVDIKSRLDVIKLSTTQEVETALKKCKQSKASASGFVGVSIEKLKQKETALLDIQSELTIVTENVRSSLTICFEKFTKSVISRIERGGSDVEKDLALLVSDARKEVSVLAEEVKSSATKRLSALETKSTTSVVSVAALSGIATAEVIRIIKSSEDLIMQRINRIHSNVWYIEKDQDMTKITETISTISKETVTEITGKFESSKHDFVCSINDHHSCGHVENEIDEVTEQSSMVLTASLSIREVKITIREWLKSLTEKVSVCSHNGKSSEEIELIVKKETELIYSYLDQSVGKMKETLKTEETLKSLDTTVEQVKATITKASTEIKSIGIQASSHSDSYGGFEKMTSVVIEHEHRISEVLVTYENKIYSKTNEQTKQQVAIPQSKEQKKVGKDIYKVVATEYTLSIVHKWFEELMLDVSECAKHEHDLTVVTKEVNTIVSEAKEYINFELSSIIKKLQLVKADSSAKQELVNIIEWTRGMVIQSSAQIQAIGINCAVAFSSTGGIEQMKPLVAATESQINVAIGRCNKTLEIEVESNSAHYEKKKTKSECIKQEIKKKADTANEKKKKESKLIKKAKESKSDSESSSDSNDKKCEKTKKKTQHKKPVKKFSDDDTSSSEDEGKKQKKTSCIDKKKVVTGIIAGGAIVKHALDQSSSDSETDSEAEKQATVIDKKKLKTGQSTYDVTIIVKEWYDRLIVDVSTCAKQGGSNVNSDIEVIVQRAVTSITETLHVISVNAHKSLADTTTVQQYQNSVEWVKNLVIQSIYQIKAIGINCAAASSKTGGIEQMRPIATSIQEQINVEIRRYKLLAEKDDLNEAKKTTQVAKVEHKENQEKVQVGRTSACDRKEYCEKLEKHVSNMVNESKMTFNSWFSDLVREVSIRVHQGSDNVEEDVKALIESSKLELENTIKRTQNKFVSSIQSSEKDKATLLIKSHFYESIEVVRSTMMYKFTEIHQLATQNYSETEFNQKLQAILQSSKITINESFEASYKQSVTIINQESVQTESTVKVIDTVEEFKTVVAQWHSKLDEEIHSISIDTSIENKEERIHALIEQATLEVENITKEAKSKISESCTSVKKISKSKEQELLSAIDHAHETFNVDVKKIQEVSVEAIKKSDSNIKQNVSSVVESSKEKIDSALTKTTAVVIGTATAAMAAHAVKKEKKAEEKKAEVKHNELSVDVDQNITVISQWFELFTKKVAECVHLKEENAVEKVTHITEHAEKEISDIITIARNDFIKRLSHQNLDQDAYEFACKHYEESLELVRITIVSEIVEVKKTAIHAHTTGNVQEFETHLIKLTETSNKKIKTAMGSSVVLKQKVDNSTDVSKNTDAHVQIEFNEDDVLIGEEEIEFERKESVVDTHKEEKIDKTKAEQVKEKKKDSSIEKILTGTLAIGAAAGAAVMINKKGENEKQKVKQDIISAHQHLKYDSGATTIESVNVLISAWFTSLIQKVSIASKSGASSQKITTIVEESRVELSKIVEHAKSYGSKYCASANDEQQYISKIEWAASVAQNQATQIQQIGINASASKSDLTKQMEALATASYHQIEITLEQMKTSIKFHQKVNKINSKKTQAIADKTDSTVVVADKPVCGKMETTVDKTKVAYTVIQETRVTTIAIFVSLYERIVYRIRQGGSSMQEDVHQMIESSEQELLKVFNEAKATSSKVDRKTRLEIEEALSSIQKTVQEQISEVKTVSIEAVSITSTDSKLAVEKVLESSKHSKDKIESNFTRVSEAITASLVVVSKTAQEATETVQGWFTSLKNKITSILEASDCSEEEKQTKVNLVVAEAETEMKVKIDKLQQATANTQKTSTATTEVTADHHLDIFFGNVKSSVQNQLDVVKTTVQNTAQVDKSKIISALEKSENKLKQEVGIHYEAVDKIANVDYITGTQQKVDTEKKDRHDSYKSTIEKAAVGAVAVAAAAAVAIDHHKKNQQTQTVKVQVVKEYSLKDVQTKIDRWFAQLTDRVTAVTKKGGNNTTEVSQIVKEAQAELEVTINEFKSQHSTTASESYSTTTETKRTFVQTLEWIKSTTLIQTTQIVEIASHSSSSSIDLATQIQNYVSATKQQVNSALEAHFENFTDSSSVVDQSKNTQHQVVGSQEQGKVTENTVQIVKETREQTQKRFHLEITVIIQESKTKITNWLVLLLSEVTTIIHGNSETIRKDILTKLDTAEREIDVIIKEIKDKFLATSKASATSHVEIDTQTLIVNSVKQTLDCVDSVRTVLALQLSVVREVITRIEVEDIDIITERLEAVINRTQTRVSHTLEHGIELAISSAFEGKVVTWSETATIPASFKGVRAIAFDLVGTVANYHKSLYEVWKKMVASKHDAVLSSLQFNHLVADWYGVYTDIKRNNFIHKKYVNDEDCLHEALIHILQRYYIKDSFTDSEIEQLCVAWRQIGVHDDVSVGVRRLKNQSLAKYATVAISDTFSTGTMVKLAQNNCLCWHAQFSAEMFAASTEASASESVVKGTIQLLGLERADELAVVSSDYQLIAAAKAQGCHAVLVEREEHSSHVEQQSIQYDIKVDGLDVFGESVQSFLEHESMAKVWNEKQAPSAPRVWVPKIKSALKQ